VNWFKEFWKGLTEKMPKESVPRTKVTMENLSNFTPRAQQVLVLARKEAQRLNHNFLGTEHLFLALIVLGQGVAVNVLGKLGLDLENVRAEVEKQVGKGPEQEMMWPIPYTPRVKKVLELAQMEARRINHTYVGTEHILLGLLCEGDGVAAKVLRSLDVDIEQTRTEILRELDPNFSASRLDEKTTSKKDETNPMDAECESSPSGKFQRPKPDPVDVSRRYDVYCVEHGQSVVYRNVLFKSIKGLFTSREFDITSLYVELELAGGKTIFLPKHTVFKFCDPGATADGEKIPPSKP
jgi:hypothetical protein